MSLDVKALADRLAAVERLAASLRSGRDGRDGRDGLDAEPAPAAERGERGARGEAGLGGRDGLDGKDFDPDLLRFEVQRSVDLIPIPRDGLNGTDGTDGKSGNDGLNGKDGTRGSRGPKGEPGAQGEPGPIGPMPAHEWDGTKVRFEDAPGEWGKFKDLRGPRGIGGGGSAQVASPTLLNSYFPNGW